MLLSIFVIVVWEILKQRLIPHFVNLFFFFFFKKLKIFT